MKERDMTACIEGAVSAVRRALLGIVSDTGLYLFLAFLFAGILDASIVFKWHQVQIDLLYTYVMIPWGVALCVLRMMRADAKTLLQPDTAILTVLFAWIVVPFFLRFGVTFNNVSSWHAHAVAIFALYASVREMDTARRERLIDRTGALFSLLTFAWCGALLYCAANVLALGKAFGGDPFGVYKGMLVAGTDCNTTAMITLCCGMMSLMSACRRKRVLSRAINAIPAVMAMVVVVLTQSRTSRYAMLIGLAVMVYGEAEARLTISSRWKRQAAAIGCAAALLVVGYIGADLMTDAAVAHYRRASMGSGHELRPEVNSTLSSRTLIWRNLFKLWAEDPKYMVIGNGVGNTGSRIVAGTAYEAAGGIAVHNTYLQLIADFGLIGLAIHAAFYLTIMLPVLRVFFAKGEARYPGGRALCAGVIALFAVGMMESAPLGAMTYTNMTLYFALAVLCARGAR